MAPSDFEVGSPAGFLNLPLELFINGFALSLLLLAHFRKRSGVL